MLYEVITNNYSLKWIDINNSNIKGEGVFNGDMGIISKIDEDMKVVTVEFDVITSYSIHYTKLYEWRSR